MQAHTSLTSIFKLMYWVATNPTYPSKHIYPVVRQKKGLKASLLPIPFWQNVEAILKALICVSLQTTKIQTPRFEKETWVYSVLQELI